MHDGGPDTKAKEALEGLAVARLYQHQVPKRKGGMVSGALK